jgi:hypothetical protein
VAVPAGGRVSGLCGRAAGWWPEAAVLTAGVAGPVATREKRRAARCEILLSLTETMPRGVG